MANSQANWLDKRLLSIEIADARTSAEKFKTDPVVDLFYAYSMVPLD